MDIMARLRGLRGEKDVSQEDVAEAIGISLRGYRNIESGESSPPLNKLILLAEYFDVSLDYLAGRSESRK